MIGCNDDGGWNEYAPIAVEGQKCKRTKDREMRFDAPAGKVDEKGRHEHLRDRNGVSRGSAARAEHCKRHGNEGYTPAHDDRRPDMQVRLTVLSRPRSGCQP